MIGVKILKGRALFTKNYFTSTKVLSISIKKPFPFLDFCILLLEFSIYNKTNYLHGKNKKGVLTFNKLLSRLCLMSRLSSNSWGGGCSFLLHAVV